MMLFFKECKRMIFSVVYIIFFVLVLLDFSTQFWSDAKNGELISEPVPGGGGYGMMTGDDPDMMMSGATESLVRDYLNNHFTTYPYGFIHTVRLNDEKSAKLTAIISKITGLETGEVYALSDCPVEYTEYYSEDETFNYYQLPEFDIKVDEQTFVRLMEETDKLLGGGSFFAPDTLYENFAEVPRTYEMAKKDYDDFALKDKVTNGFARLFCDYHGVFLALLPVFVAAYFCICDRRSKMEQLIGSRKISSLRLVLTRYAALVCVMMIPVLLTAFAADMLVSSQYGGMELDHLAMYKYSLIWVMPTVIGVTGADMLITELSSAIAAVLVQFVWFFVSIAGPLSGNIGKTNLMIRHNTPMERSLFMSGFDNFIFNRCFYTLLGIVCAVCAAGVYELKRRGVFNGFRVFGKLRNKRS